MNCLGVADPVARVVGVALAEAANAVVRVERVADPDNPLVGARPEAEVVRLDAAELVDVRVRVNRVAGARPRADRTRPVDDGNKPTRTKTLEPRLYKFTTDSQRAGNPKNGD